MKKKNILFIENSILPSRGGIEKVSDILGKSFSQDGHKCYFAFCCIDNPSIKDEQKFQMNFNYTLNRFYTLFRSFILVNNIDIIINQGITQRRVIYSLKKIKQENSKIKIINCLHNTPYFIHHIEKPKSLKARIIIAIKSILARKNIYIKEQQNLYQICDHYLVLSPKFISESKIIFQLKNDSKLQSIPNPLIYNTSNTQYDKQKIVLIVARFDENQKNIIGALRIWKQVCNTVKDWSLHIIGYGDSESLYKQYIKEENIPNIIIEGKKDNPQIFYQKASLFMMTSHYEGFSLTLIEALQNQCIPIVFQTFSSVTDIIINGKNGILIPPYQEDLYAQKMINLMQDTKQLEEYRKYSQSYLSQFTIQNIKEEWYKLF